MLYVSSSNARTHVGMRRNRNEDTVCDILDDAWALFVVADGMGGHARGKDASERATNAVAQHIVPLIATEDGEVIAQDFAALLLQGVQKANDAVYQWNEINDKLDSGTTMTAALIVGDTAFVANVGDSRTYLYRPDEGLRRVTQDHSVVAYLVEDGIIEPDDVYTHPKRSQIYRSLGSRSVEVDIFPVPLLDGDKILLCSDGLWEMVRDPQIENLLATTCGADFTTEQLIGAANANGGEDNISAVVAVMSLPSHMMAVPTTALPTETLVLNGPASGLDPVTTTASTIVKRPPVALRRWLSKVKASVLSWMRLRSS